MAGGDINITGTKIDINGGPITVDGTAITIDATKKSHFKAAAASDSGLNIYIFEYINKAFGEGVYQGVMSMTFQLTLLLNIKMGMIGLITLN